MKKLSALIICFFMVVTCMLTGCAGFSINKIKYYNEIVATVDEEKITRYDLITAYNSYGQSYYVSQKGETEQEAMESTLNLLIDRELLYQYAIDNKSTFGIEPYQVNAIIEDMFDSLDDQMEDYKTTAKKILNIKIEKDDETSETKDEEQAFPISNYKYTPRAKVINNKIVYDLDIDKNYTALIGETFLQDFEQDGIIEEIQNKYIARLTTKLEETEKENATALKNKMLSLFADDLINYEYYLRDDDGKAFDKITKNLISRYIERTFTSQIKSQYLENIRTHYLDNEVLDIDKLLTKYQDMANDSYTKYVNKLDIYKKDMKSTSTETDKIFYHPTFSDDTKFGYFAHTLFKFSEDEKDEDGNIVKKGQVTLIKELNKDDDDYDTQYANIIAQTVVDERNIKTGKVIGTKTLNQVIDEYNDIRDLSDDVKLDEFVKFMFRYTGDTATLNANMPYVVGNNGNSGMEQAFTDEAVKLMAKPAGSMSEFDINDIDSMCITSYGIHLIYFIGDVGMTDTPISQVEYAFISDSNTSNSLNLYEKTLNPLTGETYFDMLFDTVYPASSAEETYTSNTGYSAHEEDLIETSELSHKVVINRTKLDSTKASL